MGKDKQKDFNAGQPIGSKAYEEARKHPWESGAGMHPKPKSDNPDKQAGINKGWNDAKKKGK